MRRILCALHMCHLQETSVCDAVEDCTVCVCVCDGGQEMTVTVMILMILMGSITFTEHMWLT